MPQTDQQKWNAKYASASHQWDEPSRVVTSLAKFLPEQGRAIDVAGGAGRHAVWLAEQGCDVCLADISTMGLKLARARARARGFQIKTIEVDLEQDPFPSGPWDIILSHHYLWRPLFQTFASSLCTQRRVDGRSAHHP